MNIVEILDSITLGKNNNPFAWLGMHPDGSDIIVRVFYPYAETVQLKSHDDKLNFGAMEKVHQDGIFELRIANMEAFLWKLSVKEDGFERETYDAYAFESSIGDMDQWLFAEGNHFTSYEILGAHPKILHGIEGVHFALWAPNASRVSVVGDFNRWDGRIHVMRNHIAMGVWEIFIPHLQKGDVYKFELLDSHGNMLPLKADPYGFASELRPKTASVIEGLGNYAWGDEGWMAHRGQKNNQNAAISIYEVHASSWARVPEEDNRSLNWQELAEKLIPYVVEMGFSHIEFLPVSEYPFDGSWGYQPIGLFAPTARMGSADDFRYFVDKAHQAGLGILIDWVPAHFPEDEHGLGFFDGTHLYEHADPRQGKHQDWGTLIYNFGRSEVQNFLIANALFWFREYHIDGLRVDAVASMLYHDYSREEGQWIPNEYGGRENLEAMGFLKRLNEVIYQYFPDVMSVAEESTSWPSVSQPTYHGGLGFGFKWNMGWMNDTLEYIKHDPIHRKYHHNELTFSLIYAFSEKFVLPISHDEVVHGKGSLLGRMPGDQWQRFANLRTYLSYMFGHPGKKLLFMGCEIAQSDEWNFNNSLDWHLLQYPEHKGIQQLIKDLNHLYQSHPCLYETDNDGYHFAWIEAGDYEQSVLSWRRIGHDGSELVFIANFTPTHHPHYQLGFSMEGQWQEIFNSDAKIYAGSGQGNLGGIEANQEGMHGLPYSASVNIPPLAVVVFKKS
ncbi:MAG: 1,4-alpha-glucan branching protein GlgB [Alphaproteobacteria bacterium]